MLALVIYAYAQEIEARRFDRVLAALAFWGMDWWNEIANALVLHVTGRAPLWGAPGGTAYLILVGLNVEICLMFALAGLVATKTLPPRDVRILGLPNRLVLAGAWSAFCVGVEIVLNRWGALTWDWPLWSARSPVPIFLFGYLHFFLVCYWVHDMPRHRPRIAVAAGLLGSAAVALGLFGALGWI
jgi:hypothetical protein